MVEGGQITHVGRRHPNGRWRRRGTRDQRPEEQRHVARRGGSETAVSVSVCNPPPERNVWLWLKGTVVPHFHPLLITT